MWILMMVIRTLFRETFEKEEEKEKTVEICETCCQKPATMMMGFVSDPKAGPGSKSSAGWLCRGCFDIEGARYSHMGKIGQCVLMPIESKFALAWYNEANGIKEE
jgi:hypothetical protein